MSVFSREVGNWDTSGYGALLYTPAAHPGLFAAALPWQGGRAYKDLMLDFPKAAAVLVLCRDSGSGRVKIDRTGRSRVDYVIAPADREAMVRGMQAGLTAMAAAGAKAVMTLHASAEGLHAIDPGLGRQDPGFQKYLEWVAAQGVADLKMPTFSAHQMGTARLGQSDIGVRTLSQFAPLISA